MNHLALAAMLAPLLVAAQPYGAQPLAASAFAWRAPLELQPGASVARLTLPPDAMLQLQSRDARDLRVFNAAGQAVPFAFMPTPAVAPAPLSTRSYPALPLVVAPSVGSRPQGSVQVRIDDAGHQRSVSVQLDGGASAGDSGPRSALFATRTERQPLKAITVQGKLPPNMPVQLRAWSSADLAQWTRLPLGGRLYRFEGDSGPANDTLEFETPVQLEGKYLRLDWDAQAAITIDGVAGVVASASPAAAPVRGALPVPKAVERGALEIDTGFLTALSAVTLSTAKPNTLLPVRLLTRSEAGQPWRLLGQTVVYRLGGGGSGGADVTNPPMPLQGGNGRWLRIESSSGVDLSAEQLRAEAEFHPVQLAFVASGDGPFELALGRAATPMAAVPLGVVAAALGERKLQDLPQAVVGAAQRGDPQLVSMADWLAPGKPTVLWAVLVAGVLILAAVAWSLLRQLKVEAPKATD
jgi:hypothetical protein